MILELKNKKILKKDKRSGFTLIELLVVIAIIGLLSSIVMTSLSTTRRSARDARRLADITQIKSGMDLFFTNGNGYPTKASFDDAIATQSILSCGSTPIVRPVQDPFYPQAGYLYNPSLSPFSFVSSLFLFLA